MSETDPMRLACRFPILSPIAFELLSLLLPGLTLFVCGPHTFQPSPQRPFPPSLDSICIIFSLRPHALLSTVSTTLLVSPVTVFFMLARSQRFAPRSRLFSSKNLQKVHYNRLNNLPRGVHLVISTFHLRIASHSQVFDLSVYTIKCKIIRTRECTPHVPTRCGSTEHFHYESGIIHIVPTPISLYKCNNVLYFVAYCLD